MIAVEEQDAICNSTTTETQGTSPHGTDETSVISLGFYLRVALSM